MVVAQPYGDDTRIVMLVVLNRGYTLDDSLKKEIRKQLRENASPRHMPGVIEAVTALPYTRSGKKVEIAVARLLRGMTINNTGAIANPESLDEIRGLDALELDDEAVRRQL
jgi:acetoacetyl-CoA synthetase